MNPDDNLTPFERLVYRMRLAQTGFFHSREQRLLLEAKDLERRVDGELRGKLYPPRPTLFDPEGGGA